jgi:Ca2+/Na+ antiporter
MRPTGFRAGGGAVAIGGVAWGAAFLFSPSTSEQNSTAEIRTSALFQLGLLALLAMVWVTAGGGTGRWSRRVLAAEIVAVVLAAAWTVPYLFDANRPDNLALTILDPFWPLSMVGLIAVAVLVVRARRWPQAARRLALAASLLVPVDLAVSWAPTHARTTVTGLYLTVAYGLLGLTLIREARALSAVNRPTTPVS